MPADYYLISAARRAHRLRPGRGYVFGRDPAADIRLDDTLASRRHAEVRWRDDESWEVADLGSRNGVMRNGERITTTTPLADGDQIQIGGQVFRYHLLPPGGDPASLSAQAPQISEVETMGPGLTFADMAGQGAAFTGALSEGSLMDVVQFLHTTRRSGRLDLLGSALGSVWVDQGVPVHASFKDATGVDALADLAVDPPPRFAFHAGATPEMISILSSAQGTLMEVARMVDEARRG